MPSLNPIFLNKSLITDVDFITDNTGGSTPDSLRLRLFDRDTTLLYRSVGVSSGDRIVTIDFGSALPVDTIFIQNHNMQDFKIESDGPAFVQVNPPGGPADVDITGNIERNSYFEISTVVTQTVTITCSEIFGAVSGELELGEVYIGNKRFRLLESTGGEIVPIADVAQSIIKLSDNTNQKLFIRKIKNYRFALIGVPREETVRYCQLYDLNRVNSFAFVFRPEITHPDFAPENIWDGEGAHYNWINALDIFEFTDVTGNLFNVNIDLQQAGGLD